MCGRTLQALLACVWCQACSNECNLDALMLYSLTLQGHHGEYAVLPCRAVRAAQANNSLAGGLSAQWLSALPPALTTLALYDNPLGGSFPVGVDLSHTRLEILSLGSNQLSGTLPEDVTWPTTLQYLSFVSEAAGAWFQTRHAPSHTDFSL